MKKVLKLGPDHRLLLRIMSYANAELNDVRTKENVPRLSLKPVRMDGWMICDFTPFQ